MKKPVAQFAVISLLGNENNWAPIIDVFAFLTLTSSWYGIPFLEIVCTTCMCTCIYNHELYRSIDLALGIKQKIEWTFKRYQKQYKQSKERLRREKHDLQCTCTYTGVCTIQYKAT